jgi:hypothetical protein
MGVPDALSLVVRGVVRDGGAREGIARCGEVSRGRITSGDRYRWEGPNVKPSVRTFVLVVIASIAANPSGAWRGGSDGEA